MNEFYIGHLYVHTSGEGDDRILTIESNETICNDEGYWRLSPLNNEEAKEFLKQLTELLQ